jgi:predicted nucleotidyltransferase
MASCPTIRFRASKTEISQLERVASPRGELFRLGAYSDFMVAQLDEVLSAAALNEVERRVVERIVGRLRSEIGSDLLAVWLYGSRARGEADPTETDPDLRSDVDLLAIVGGSRSAEDLRRWAQPMVEAEGDAEGDSPVYYSLRVFDADWLRGRRRIDSFFIQEVDRDKLILAGDELEGDDYR